MTCLPEVREILTCSDCLCLAFGGGIEWGKKQNQAGRDGPASGFGASVRKPLRDPAPVNALLLKPDALAQAVSD